MEFGQEPTTPPLGRAPHPRHRPAIDGFAPAPRRPVAPQPLRRDASQPVFAQRGGDYLRDHAHHTATQPIQEVTEQVPAPAPTPWVHPAPMSSPALAPVSKPAPAPRPWTHPAHRQVAAQPQPAAPPPNPAHEPEHLDFRPAQLRQPIVTQPKPEDQPAKPKLHKRAAHQAKKAGHGLKKVAPKLAIGLAIIGILGAGGWLLDKHYKAQTPEVIFQDTLLNMLATTGLATNASVGPASLSQGPTNTVRASLDLSVTTNPKVSTSATINFYGSQFQFKGYGDLKTNYISYQDLPPAVSKDIVSAVQGRWLKLRANGLEGTGVPGLLQKLSDPHYQAFGPVIFGNFSESARQKLVNYALANKVYSYKPAAITKATIDDQKVLVYPVKINVSYLKILNQSAASSEGIAPTDIQVAIDALGKYADADIQIAINASTHRVVRLTATSGNIVTAIDYSDFDPTKFPDEPVTNLSWSQFQLTQLQIEAQTAARETASQIDAQRQADFATIRAYLKTYFKLNGFYPLLTDLNDQVWIAANMPGFDTDSLHNPLANNSLLADKPSPTNYSYHPSSDGNKGLCDNTPLNPCLHYTLGTNMSSGQLYSVTDLDK